MDAAFDALIMTISYSHDIATALLAVSALTMLILSRTFPKEGETGVEIYFLRLYRGITRMAKDSLYWILIAGVPRIAFYYRYEWSDAAGDLQVVAIIIKHAVMFALVGMGLFYWSRLSRRIQTLKLKHNSA